MNCAPTDYVCIANNCSGYNGLSGAKLFNYWEINNCPVAYAQVINTGANGTLQYNPANQLAVQDDVTHLFDTYLSTNQITDNVTSSSYNSFQNTLLDLCIDPTLPGVCNNFLTGFCANRTRSSVQDSPILIDFCGCYVPPDPEYLKYTLGTPPCLIGATGCMGCTGGETGCAGQPSCDPLCHRALTSQKAYQPTGDFITCSQNICVIDNVTINATGAQIAGGINFNTVCFGCGGAEGGPGCLCVVSGVNVSGTFASVGLGTNYNQFCGGNSVCLVTDSEGNVVSSGGCTGINPLNIPISTATQLPNLGIIFIMILIVLLVFFIGIAATFEGPIIVPRGYNG